MNGQVFPLFENIHVLKTRMLTELRDYAYEFGSLLYEGASDGIVSGCAITTTRDTITLNRGILRYGGNLYLITEPITMTYHPTDVYTLFKLAFKEETRRNGYIYREVEASLTDRLELLDGEIELCRFKLKTGARLRDAYMDFSDRNTEFDTVNRIHVPFSASGESSISPEITRAFALEAIDCSVDAIDMAFIMRALDAKRALSRDTVIAYIAVKQKKKFEACGNLEIFEALLAILYELRDNGEREMVKPRRRPRHIIVD